MRRLARRAPALALLAAVAACGPEPPLRLAVAPDPLSPDIARQLAAVAADAGIAIQVEVAEGSLANLRRLERGEADLTIVENNAPYTHDVRTLLPLYQSVLHVLHRSDARPRTAEELLRGSTVYAGPPGAVGRWFLRLLREQIGLSDDAFTLVDEGEGEDPDVVFLFAPVSPKLTASIEDGYVFFSIGDVDELGRGSLVEGLSVEYPQIEPFVLPAQTYGRANPGPVLSASVSTLLVGRADLPEAVVYDLVRTLLEHKPEIATAHPALFAGMREDFDPDRLNFPLHPGARAWLERDEPGVFERYAELAGVAFSVSLALLSALIALWRWRDRAKKNRIDGYYAQVLKVRAGTQRDPSREAQVQALERIQELQTEAFEELMAERLSADESFRIFVQLANDVRQELEREVEAQGAATPAPGAKRAG